MFLNFLFRFWNIHQILDFLGEKMTLIVYGFFILLTEKDVVR